MKPRLLQTALIFLMTGLAGPARSATVSVGRVNARPGGTAHIAVVVDGDIDLAGVNLRLEADPAVFPSLTASPGELLEDSHAFAYHVPEPGRINLVAYAPPGAPSLGGRGGTLCSIAMRVSPSAATGEYEVSFTTSGTPFLAACGLSGVDGTALAHVPVPGSVTVHESLEADVNLDGNVDSADLILILRDWHKVPDAYAPLSADVNGDERIDEMDLLILQSTWREGDPSQPAHLWRDTGVR